jgi:hexosaminidase
VIARHFNTQVDQFLKNPKENEAATAITNYLSLWASNHELLKPVIQRRPQLKEIESLSADLATIAKIGLEAVNFIGKNHNAQKAWHDNSIQKIRHASNPRGQAEIAVIKGIEQLVNNVKY